MAANYDDLMRTVNEHVYNDIFSESLDTKNDYNRTKEPDKVTEITSKLITQLVAAILILLAVITATAFTTYFVTRNKNECKDVSSCFEERFKVGNSSSGNSTDRLRTPPMTKDFPYTSQSSLSTVRTWNTHVCQIAGGCTSPPKPKGTECISANTRTFVRYTSLNRTNDVQPFDYCPVSVCTKENIWSSYKVSNSERECFNKTVNSYKGKRTCTETGRTCQRWDTDYPHKRYQTFVPTTNADFHSNYCRDYGTEYENEPWCYTTDPARRWEYCGIPMCKNMDG